MATDIHLGFGRETACGVAYYIGALGLAERADGSRIKITGTVKAATCASCQEFFTGKGGGAAMTDRRRKLDEGQVVEIIEIYAAGGVTQSELAAEYGMGLSTINRIICRSRAAMAGAVPHR